MSESSLTDFLLLPKLKLSHFEQGATRQALFYCTVESLSDFCPDCGLETNRVHDRRKVKIKDAPHGITCN